MLPRSRGDEPFEPLFKSISSGSSTKISVSVTNSLLVFSNSLRYSSIISNSFDVKSSSSSKVLISSTASVSNKFPPILDAIFVPAKNKITEKTMAFLKVSFDIYFPPSMLRIRDLIYFIWL